MLENKYQRHIVKRLETTFDGCMILKNDSGYRQGIPDLLILYNDRWAMLEVKAAYDFSFQPNQAYYLGILNDMSFAAVIYPENEDEIFNDLQHTFSARRQTRLSKR